MTPIRRVPRGFRHGFVLHGESRIVNRHSCNDDDVDELSGELRAINARLAYAGHDTSNSACSIYK